jgi:tuberous sclerosis protein 2
VQDDISHVMFHVATMMPSDEADPNFNNKRRHIGNDFVVILWTENESIASVDLGTVRSSPSQRTLTRPRSPNFFFNLVGPV